MIRILSKSLPIVILLSIFGGFARPAAETIFDAAGAGDLMAVVHLLDQDPSLVNSVDESKRGPLHFACAGGHLEIVQLLLERGADIDLQNYGGHTPLHSAAVRDRLDTVKLLTAKGAALEIKDNYGRTPLLLSTRESGNVEVKVVLLDAGADINTEDKGDDRPIDLAAWRGFKGLVNLFIDRGADIDVGDPRSSDLLIFSASKELTRLFDLLKDDGADLDIVVDNGGTLLHSAAEGGSAGIVKSLVGLGFDVNGRDRYGWTPLHYACDRGRIEVAGILLDAEASPVARDLSGSPPAAAAALKGHADLADLVAGKAVENKRVDFPVLDGEYPDDARPGREPQLFSTGVVSSKDSEHGSVTISPDFREIYWSASVELSDSGYSSGIVMSMKKEGNSWTPPRYAFFSTFETDDDVPFFSPDGNRLFFISARPVSAEAGGWKENIWFMEREEGSWSSPRPLGQNVNSMQTHWQFSVSSMGNLYFSSSDGGGYGMGDLYLSRYENGEYAVPENLGDPINSEYSEGSPFIAPDESYILYSLFGGPDGVGGSDICVSFRDDDGGWDPPVVLPEPVNSRSNDHCPMVSPDGKYLFFISHRNGASDIWWVDSAVIDQLKNR